GPCTRPGAPGRGSARAGGLGRSHRRRAGLAPRARPGPDRRRRLAVPAGRAVTPSVVGSAPGRVNLIGEHTDYNGGLALPLAWPQRTVARVTPRRDAVVTVASTAADAEPVTFALPTRPGDVTGWAAYVAGVFWALGSSG